jgi:hypothetical protein
MTGIAGSVVNFQDLKSGRIHSTAIALQDTEALADFQLNLRPELQVHRPMAGLYFVVKHLITLLLALCTGFSNITIDIEIRSGRIIVAEVIIDNYHGVCVRPQSNHSNVERLTIEIDQLANLILNTGFLVNVFHNNLSFQFQKELFN